MKAVLISNSSFMFLLHIYFSKVVLCISSGGTFHKWEGFCYNFLIRYQFSHLIISNSKTGGCEDAKMLRCRGGFKDLQTRRQKMWRCHVAKMPGSLIVHLALLYCILTLEFIILHLCSIFFQKLPCFWYQQTKLGFAM